MTPRAHKAACAALRIVILLLCGTNTSLLVSVRRHAHSLFPSAAAGRLWDNEGLALGVQVLTAWALVSFCERQAPAPPGKQPTVAAHSDSRIFSAYLLNPLLWLVPARLGTADPGPALILLLAAVQERSRSHLVLWTMMGVAVALAAYWLPGAVSLLVFLVSAVLTVLPGEHHAKGHVTAIAPWCV